MASSEFLMGLWIGWPSWALVKRPLADTPAEWISRSDHSLVVTLVDLSNTMTAVPASLLADRMGRKGCVLTVGVGVVASFSMLYAPTRWAIFAARTTAGVTKSLVYATVSAFVAEVSLSTMRGRFNVASASFDAIGMLVAVTAGPRIPYNIMNALTMFAGVLFLLAVLRIPETPIVLLSKGKTDEARRAFAWYRPNLTEEENERLFTRLINSVNEDMSNPGTYHELFTDMGNLYALIVVILACLAQRTCGLNSLTPYMTTTLPADGPIKPENVATLFGLIRLMFTLSAGTVVDRFGHRPLLVGSHMCMAAITAAYAYRLYVEGKSTTGYVPVICIVLFTVAYSLGAGPVPGALLGEMFPANVKNKAVGIVSVTASLGNAALNLIYLPVTDSLGEYVMFLVFCAINLTWAICAFFFLFETRGLTLSTIQEVLDEYDADIRQSLFTINTSRRSHVQPQ